VSIASLPAATVLVALGFGAGSLALRPPDSKRFAAHGSAWVALCALVALAPGAPLAAPLQLVAVLVLLLAVVAAVWRTSSAGWLLGAAVVSAPVLRELALAASRSGASAVGAQLLYAGQALAALLLVGSVLLLRPAARSALWTYRVAALLLLAFLLSGLDVHRRFFGDDSLVAVPLGLAAIAFAVAYALRWRGPEDPAIARGARIWLWGAGVGLCTLAVPIEWKDEWLTIGWAAEGLLLLALWRRYDYSGLKYLGFALGLLVTVRLVLNPAVLGYHERGELRILNWLSTAYLLPAGCLLGSGRALRDLEVGRRRPWEREMGPLPLLSLVLAGAAIATLFVWVNLTIVDIYSTGPRLDVTLHHQPARDLTLSLGWALFGLGLLTLGMLRTSRALRVSSLVLILATCAKVFLYDLSNLADLYRVFSLVGLALSLIAISFAYKRFVFRDEAVGAAPKPAEAELGRGPAEGAAGPSEAKP
jgi:uncharacterized membrane protein